MKGTPHPLVMIPGPTPVRDSILEALARPTTSHQDPAFVATFRRCLDDLARVVRTRQGRPFVVAGAGTLAMEMALVNLLGPDEPLLILSHGWFGDRWVELAEAFGLEHEVLRAEWGRAVPPERVLERIAARRFAAVALTHVDTSTGTCSPVEAYIEALRGSDALVVLDGVCATAGIDERFDDWGLDVLVTGAQKAFGCPPGVAILVASARAIGRRKAKPRVPAYYADLLRWIPVMEDPARYFSTPAVNEVVALAEGVRLAIDEGLDARFARHARLAAAIRSGLGELGLEPFTEPGFRADTLTVVRHAEGIDDAAFRRAVAARGVIVAGALGPIAGRAFRIGHMGNIGAAEIERTIAAVGGALAEQGRPVVPDRAVRAALSALGSLDA